MYVLYTIIIYYNYILLYTIIYYIFNIFNKYIYYFTIFIVDSIDFLELINFAHGMLTMIFLTRSKYHSKLKK